MKAATGILAAILTATPVWAAQLEDQVLRELNHARTDPASFVPVLRDRLRYFDGRVLRLPGQVPLQTREGASAVKEAIADLSKRPKLRPVVADEALTKAARDHVRDQGKKGLVDHKGTDGSMPSDRMARYGFHAAQVAENISYGPNDGKDVIADLLVDDGVKGRGHRNSLLNPSFTRAGIACGPHARFGTMCVIDLGSDPFPDRKSGKKSRD